MQPEPPFQCRSGHAAGCGVVVGCGVAFHAKPLLSVHSQCLVSYKHTKVWARVSPSLRRKGRNQHSGVPHPFFCAVASCSSQKSFSLLTKEGQGTIFIYFIVKLEHGRETELWQGVVSTKPPCVLPASRGACFLPLLLQFRGLQSGPKATVRPLVQSERPPVMEKLFPACQ